MFNMIRPVEPGLPTFFRFRYTRVAEMRAKDARVELIRFDEMFE